MYEFWCDSVKPKHCEETKMCCMDKDGQFHCIHKTDLLPPPPLPPQKKIKNKKVLELMKDELDGENMTKFFRLTARTYSYLIDDSSEN